MSSSFSWKRQGFQGRVSLTFDCLCLNCIHDRRTHCHGVARQAQQPAILNTESHDLEGRRRSVPFSNLGTQAKLCPRCEARELEGLKYTIVSTHRNQKTSDLIMEARIEACQCARDGLVNIRTMSCLRNTHSMQMTVYCV